jgi:DNA-binding NarL/FixJ family response regulator
VKSHAAINIDDARQSCASHASLTLPVRIMVVDDHGIVREGLALLLDSDKGMKVVGFAANGAEAVLTARRLKPAMIIMDLMLPDLNGIDATRRILNEFPQTRIIALSACNKAEHVHRALRCGARGYVLKTAPGAELLLAVQAVAAGDRYVSPSMTTLFVDGAPPTESIQTSPLDRLSARERDVLRDIVAGSTSLDIARHLCLSRKTVDTYRSRIMVKLGVSNRSALIRFALEYDLPAV